jgi:hypothetical protein
MYNIIPINEFTYSLNIQGDYNPYLYSAIQKIIKLTHIDHETNSIYFLAEKVIPFKTFILNQPNKKMSYHKCIQLIDDLTKQIMFLRKFGYGIYEFGINDILTIDKHFIFCSTQNMLPLTDDSFIFNMPIKHQCFSSPELYKLTRLPARLSYKCCYYSLGTFIIFCLLNVNLLVGNEIKSPEEIEKIIEPLHDTKIYWFIKRCLAKDIDNRLLLLL